MKKRLMLLVVTLLAFSIVGCGVGAADSDYDEEEYYEEDYDYEEDEEYEEDSSEDAGEVIAFIRSGDGVKKVYELFTKYKLTNYFDLNSTDWFAMDTDQQEECIDKFYAFAADLDIGTEEGSEEIDEYLAFYFDEDYPSEESIYQVCMGLSLMYYEDLNADMFYDIYSYEKLVEAGEVVPIPQEMMAYTTSFAVQAYVDTTNICLGRNEISVQLTSAVKSEPDMMQMGSITTPLGGFMDQGYSGNNGIFNEFYIGDLDLLPVFEKLGAVSSEGNMLFTQLEVAHKGFEVEKIALLSKDENEKISIAVLIYDEDSNSYVWDGEVYYGKDYVCFTTDGEVCYISEAGDLEFL